MRKPLIFILFLFALLSLPRMSHARFDSAWFDHFVHAKNRQQSTLLQDLQKNANLGKADAEYMLGFMRFYGSVILQDKIEGLTLLRRSAEKNYQPAQYRLGYILYWGTGAPTNKKDAAKWFGLSANSGYTLSQYMFGLCNEFGEGLSKDPVAARHWYLTAAKARHPGATYRLSLAYRFGIGGMADLKKADHWLLIAADRGDSSAQRDLGYYYEKGTGRKVNVEEALRWYKQAAAQGNTTALVNLGVLYEEGHLLPRDMKKAVSYYRQAAEKGDKDGQFNLGLKYDQGDGVTADKKEACRWYLLAAEQGEPKAQVNLGVCYSYGTGVKQDKAAAFRWYLKSATSGNLIAQNHLAYAYWAGDGTPKNPNEAKKWYRAAALQGDKKAAEIFEDMDRRLPKNWPCIVLGLSLLVACFIFLIAAVVLMVRSAGARFRAAKAAPHCPRCGRLFNGRYCSGCGKGDPRTVAYAGLNKRVPAALIDLFFLLMLDWAIGEHLPNIFNRSAWLFAHESPDMLALIIVAVLIAKSGQTPGKYLTGTKVLRSNLDSPSFYAALRRGAFGFFLISMSIASSIHKIAEIPPARFKLFEAADRVREMQDDRFISIFLGLALAWCFALAVSVRFGKKRRALHDYFSDTVVIDMGASVKP